MSVKLVTGYAGTPHVTAAQDGERNAGILSVGSVVLGTNDMLAAEIISNNAVRIKSGTMVNQGRQYTIEVDDYETVTIDNGAQGKYRNDIIAFRYSMDESTKIETVECVVIKGTAGTTTVDPILETGNILDGDTLDEAALYRVRLEGLNIVAVEPMFDVVMTMAELQNKVKEQENGLAELNSNFITGGFLCNDAIAQKTVEAATQTNMITKTITLEKPALILIEAGLTYSTVTYDVGQRQVRMIVDSELWVDHRRTIQGIDNYVNTSRLWFLDAGEHTISIVAYFSSGTGNGVKVSGRLRATPIRYF